MSFQEVATNVKFIKYNECTKGDVLAEGWWYRSTTDPKYGRTIYIVGEDGKEVGLGKAGQLDYKLQKVALEDYIKIIYLGREEYPGGPTGGSHQFSVFIDPTRRGKRLSTNFSEVGEEPKVDEDEALPF